MTASGERHELTDAEVWAFIVAGCNANEIAEFAGISKSATYALMARATNAQGRKTA